MQHEGNSEPLIIELTPVPLSNDHFDSWFPNPVEYFEAVDNVVKLPFGPKYRPPGISGLCLSDLIELQKELGRVLLLAGTSAGVIAAYKGLYQLMRLWVAYRNGRKLKIRIGDIEVEATQMKESDVLRIFDLLQEKADRQKIREVLLEAKGRLNMRD